MEPVSISADKSLLDTDFVHRFLSEQTYWAKGISAEIVNRSIENSICFGVYLNNKQIGFARTITDQATFAYLADVFILPEHRGRGLSKELVKFILAYPQLQGLRRWVLLTADADGLYKQFGFEKPDNPERYMEIRNPNIYPSAPKESHAGPKT